MRSLMGAVAAAVVLAGCGTVAAAPAGGYAARTSAVRTVAATGSFAQAEALARHLVAEMRFPRGTRPSSLRSAPSGLRDPGPSGPGWAHAVRLLVAPVKPAAVWATVLSHPPFNSDALMGPAASNGPVGSDVLLPAPEPGIDAAEAAVWVKPWAKGSTLIAAYGFATWLPLRTAAEHLDPARFRSVTVSAEKVVSGLHRTTRTFTSAAVIAKLAAFLNGRPAAPEIAVPCPLPPVSYQLRFTPKARGGPVVDVALSCLTDQITVNGVDQPLVWDTQGGLAQILSRLPGLP